MDDVLAKGWAYGDEGDKLKGKKDALAISMGIKECDYQPDGKYKATIDQFIVPFKTTALYCNLDFKGYFALYDSRHITYDELEKNSRNYVRFVLNL